MAKTLQDFMACIVTDAEFRCLVIDALYLSSATVEFALPAPLRGAGKGRLYTGDLYEFLLDLPIPNTEEERYDILVLDFCGSGNKNLNCFDVLCEKLLIADMAVGSITLCSRTTYALDFTKQEKLDAANYMHSKAVECGYSIRFYGELEHKTMFSLFFKMIHNVGALHAKYGIKTAPPRHPLRGRGRKETHGCKQLVEYTV